ARCVTWSVRFGLSRGWPMTDVGLLGSGSAGGLYLRHGGNDCSLRYVACADVDLDRAAALASEFGVPRACTPAELLADPDVDVVVNLTPPPLHGPTGLDV